MTGPVEKALGLPRPARVDLASGPNWLDVREDWKWTTKAFARGRRLAAHRQRQEPGAGVLGNAAAG